MGIRRSKSGPSLSESALAGNYIRALRRSRERTHTQMIDSPALPLPDADTQLLTRRAHRERARASSAAWAAGAVLLAALVYLVTLVFLPKQGFWLIDNGNKFLQMRALIESGYRSAVIPCPGQALDPKFDFNPLPFPFSVVKAGRLYSIFCPVFALLSSLPYRAFGFTGLYVLPFLASLGTLAGVFALGRLLGLGTRSRAAAVLLAALGTPLWFYSVNFWEHIVAVCLLTWAIVLCLTYRSSGQVRHIMGGGALAALAVYFRDELYLFLPVLLGAVLLQLPRERWVDAGFRFIEAGVFALVPLWCLNTYYTGSPMGFHLGEHIGTSHGLLGHLGDRYTVFYRLLAALHIQDSISWVIALPYLALYLRNPQLARERFQVAVPVACLLATASFGVTLSGYLATTGTAHGPIWTMLNANSLFSASPLLILAFLRLRGDEEAATARKALWLIALGYPLLYCMVAPSLGTYSTHWGNRFFLMLYPLLALLCVANLAAWLRTLPRRRVLSLAAVGLAAVASLGAQVYSINLLYRAQLYSCRLNRVVGQAPEEVVVTNSWFVPQDLHLVFNRKKIFIVRDDADWRSLRSRLEAAGVRQILFLENYALFPFGPVRPGTQMVDDYGLVLRKVRLAHLALAPRP